MCDGDVSTESKQKLEQELDNFHTAFITTLESLNNSFQQYNDGMQKSLNENEFLSRDDFLKTHQNMKSQVITQVISRKISDYTDN